MDMMPEAGARPDTVDFFGDESDDDEQLQPAALAAPAELPETLGDGTAAEAEAEDTPQAPTSADKRSKLQILADRKRKQAEEAAAIDAEKQANKKRRKEKQRALAEEQAPAAPAGADQAPINEADLFGDNEDDETEPVRTAQDDAFIDDAGVEPDDNFNPEGGGQQFVEHPEAEEAEDEDEIEAMLNGGKRRRGEAAPADLHALVDGFLSKMEAAAWADREANKQQRPAVAKLGLLPEMQRIFTNKKVHADFIDSGLLGVLKAWVELMPDGSLPNASIRTAVLKLLQQLNVDVSMEGRREQLRKSALGKVVMFLFKLPDETPANRRLAKDLVYKWSRPIFEEYRDQAADEARHDREMGLAKARQARQAQASATAAVAAEDEDREKRALKPGDPGFRWHANVPEPAKLDYMRRPQSKITVDTATIGKPGKRDKLFRKLQKKKQDGGRAAHVSVQGREIHL